MCVYYTLDWRACISNQDFERLRVKNNEMCVTGTRAKFKRLRTSRDREFERSGVNLLCYIEEKNGTAVLLREIENFERSEFEPSRVTCKWLYI